jgi:hypothetical protein
VACRSSGDLCHRHVHWHRPLSCGCHLAAILKPDRQQDLPGFDRAASLLLRKRIKDLPSLFAVAKGYGTVACRKALLACGNRKLPNQIGAMADCLNAFVVNIKDEVKNCLGKSNGLTRRGEIEASKYDSLHAISVAIQNVVNSFFLASFDSPIPSCKVALT